MNTATIPHVVEDFLKQFGLYQTGWRFAWDNARRRAGSCQYAKKRITLSRHFVKLNVDVQPDEVFDCILHEIAHAIAGPGTYHGPEWVKACENIGAKPERCYDSSKVVMPKGRLTATCPGCSKVFHRHKKLTKNRWSYCMKCGPESGVLSYKDETASEITSLPPTVVTLPPTPLAPRKLRGST